MPANRRLRALLISQYYHPEIGAAQTRLLETVQGLRTRDIDVTVLTTMPSYPLGVVAPGYRWWRPTTEVVGETRVIRVPAPVLMGSTVSRRMMNHAGFATASLAALGIASRYDVALVESPPLFTALGARALRAAGLPYVFHVADPWPDFPIAMGYLRSPVLRRAAFWLEDLAYRRASAITTVSPGLVDLLRSKPSAGDRVQLVPNGVDLARFGSLSRSEVARARLGWANRFTAVYVGTVGKAQGTGTLLEAARRLDDEIRIRIVGEGVEKAGLVRRCEELGLSNVSFDDSVTAAQVPEILAAADAAFVLLRRGPLYEDSLPTKLLEAMAAARPVIVSADGLAARIIQESGGGYVAPSEDAEGLARAITSCRDDMARVSRGVAGRDFVARDYDREIVLDRLAVILEKAARSS